MDVFDLVAKISLDDSQYEDQLKDSKEKTSRFADGLKNGLKTAAKVGAAALAAAGTAAIALAKQAVQSYAEYEQLVGGVETLFGTSADKVLEFANEAFKSAGLSANEYMETVTSFSASLLQSLGGDTAKAADYADMAIRDMSDNANKMGTDMSAIQSAYQGFAKQNYTMLDNLKLGYGGTKTEMERLIKDAENLDSSFKAARDENGELAMSYSDIVDAIHIVQTEMGVTGTTAKEAASTISGSVGMVKASWKNLITGLADENANFDELLDNFIESVTTAGDNIIPRVKIALDGVTKLVASGVEKLTPIVVDVLVENMPLLIQAGVSLLTALIKGIVKATPQILGAMADLAAQLLTAIGEWEAGLFRKGAEILLKVKEGIASRINDLLATGRSIITKLKDGISAKVSEMLNVGRQVVENIKSGISQKWTELTTWFTNIWDRLFKNKKVSVDVETGEAEGSHAIGLDYVPTNKYMAELHRGEAVLTATEAEEWRRGKTLAAYDPNVAVIVELLEEIVANGLNANVSGRSLYNAVRKENTTRTRATNYNALAMA